jgi:hypothetical protein
LLFYGFTLAFDLACETTQRTRKLPRDLKFVLGNRMLTTAFDVLDILHEAKYGRTKKALLQRANLLLERLRFQGRLCMEEHLIRLRQYEYVSDMINDGGRMVGGWAKSVDYNGR